MSELGEAEGLGLKLSKVVRLSIGESILEQLTVIKTELEFGEVVMSELSEVVELEKSVLLKLACEAGELEAGELEFGEMVNLRLELGEVVQLDIGETGIVTRVVPLEFRVRGLR